MFVRDNNATVSLQALFKKKTMLIIRLILTLLFTAFELQNLKSGTCYFVKITEFATKFLLRMNDSIRILLNIPGFFQTSFVCKMPKKNRYGEENFPPQEI